MQSVAKISLSEKELWNPDKAVVNMDLDGTRPVLSEFQTSLLSLRD